MFSIEPSIMGIVVSAHETSLMCLLMEPWDTSVGSIYQVRYFSIFKADHKLMQIKEVTIVFEKRDFSRFFVKMTCIGIRTK